MKELLKSKIIIVFVVMVLGVCYLDSAGVAKLEEKNSDYKEIMALNIK